MKILHYMPVPSVRYNEAFINMILNNDIFRRDEHFFWLTSGESYKMSKNHLNVFLKTGNVALEMKKKQDNIDIIVIHGLDFRLHELFFLNTDARLRKKMIWIVWGHDLYRVKNTNIASISGKIKYCIKMIICILIQVPFVKNIKCIGIGFPYDEKEIRKWYGNKICVKSAPYDLGYDYKSIKNLKQSMKANKVCGNTTNILLGHSAYEFLNHIQNLKRLEKYQECNMKIYIPLNYGDANYKKRLMEYISTSELDIEVLDDMLSMNEYLLFLSKMDIAIFDFDHQAALGNIYLLLYLEKKIYLSKQGIIYNGLREQDIAVFSTDTIGEIEFEEFKSNNFDASRGVMFSKKKLDCKEIVNDWNQLFLYCREGE